MKYLKVTFICILLVLFLIACEQESSDTSPTEPETTNTPPTASFTVSATVGNCPCRIDFDASNSTDPDATISSFSLQSHSISQYEWDFGDGYSKKGKTVFHTYREGGEFDATLTVTDDQSSTATSSRTITIRSLTGTWTGWIETGSGKSDVTLNLIQDDRDLSGLALCPWDPASGSTTIEGRYKTDGTIEMTWTSPIEWDPIIRVLATPNQSFNALDGNIYDDEGGFTGEKVYFIKVGNSNRMPASHK